MRYEILVGDVMEKLGTLADESVHCVVTSPPYWGLRDYGTGTWEGGDADCQHRSPTMREGRNEDRQALAGSVATNAAQLLLAHRTACGKCGAMKIDQQIGLEKTPGEYIAKMVAVFREVRRVLRSDGTCWVNLGDSYASSTTGSDSTNSTLEGGKKTQIAGGTIRPNKIVAGLKPKDLVGMPWRLAFALQADGWWLRSDIIWSKPNPMPESVTDRPTKAHEYLFLLTKSARYYYDAEAIKEQVAGDPESSRNRWDTKDYLIPGQKPQKRSGRAAGNKSHKLVTEYEESDSEEHRTAAGLMKIADTAYATRNKRSVWEIATEAFPEAHFATFPTKLVEPCILAGTSEKGCCEACGAPWVRMVEKSGGTIGKGWHDHKDDMGRGQLSGASSSGMKDYKVETIGWKPSCKCSAPTTPCTVLDCFNGSGTTGLVALANRCNYIGIELSPEYAAMSERRLAAATAQGVLV